MTARAIAIAALALLSLGCGRRLAHPEVPKETVRAQIEDDAPAAFAALIGVYDRLLRVGERLRRANTPSCHENLVSSLGWLALADRDFGGLEMRRLAAQFAQADKRPVVIALAPEGAAARAGMLVGDHVLSIAGRQVRTATQATRAEKSLAASGESVVVEREGKELTLPVTPDRACRPDVLPTDRLALDARPRGDSIFVGLTVVELASDDELAFTIAHAMAAQLLGIDPARVETPEPEATALAVELSERAGFSVSGVETFLELQGTEQPWNLVGHRLPERNALWRVSSELSVGDIPRKIVALRQVRALRAAAQR